MRWAKASEVFDALLFVYLFAAAAEVVVTESQPEHICLPELP